MAAFSGGAGRLHRLRRRPSCSGPERGASLRVIPLLVPPRDHYLVSSGGRRGVIVPGMRVLDLGSGAPRRGLPCRRCWSATQVRSSGSTELLLRGRRDGKGECPSSLTSSRTAFSCTSRQRRSTSTGVRRWNATNVGGAKKQTERAARWNHPRSSSSALAAPRRPPATRRRSSARSGRELRIARRIARRHSISPSSRGCGQARPRRQGGEWQRRETHAGLRWVPYVAPRI